MPNKLPTTAAPDVDTLIQRLTQAHDSYDVIKTPRIAVVGDFCLDKYLYVYPSLDEISVETGIVARQIRAKRLFAGVGGTIASNLRALGAETYCFGVVGEDGEGFDLLKALRKIGANVEGIVVSPEILTGVYMKPMTPNSTTSLKFDARSRLPLPLPDEGEWIEGSRLDIRNPRPIPSTIVDELKKRFLAAVSTFDAVVVSDQFPPGSEAAFSESFRTFLSETALVHPNVFFLCDSRFFINSYRNVMAKCNANEILDAYEAAHGGVLKRETTLDLDADDNFEKLLHAGKWLAQRNCRPVLVTRGSKGSLLLQPETNSASMFIQTTIVPSNPVEPPIDICGAGDATNAGLAFGRSLGLNLVDSAYLAGIVSSITIKKIGVTGVASIPEILDVLRSKLD